MLFIRTLRERIINLRSNFALDPCTFNIFKIDRSTFNFKILFSTINGESFKSER